MSDDNNYFAPLSPQSMEFMNLLEKQLAQQSQQDSSPSKNSNSTNNNMFGGNGNGISPSANQYGYNSSNGGRSQSNSQSPLSDYTSNPFGSSAFSGNNNPSRYNSNGASHGNNDYGVGKNNQSQGQAQTPNGIDFATLLPLLQANGFGGMLAGLNGGNGGGSAGNQNNAGLGRSFGQAGGNMFSNGYNNNSNGFNASMTGNNNNGQMVLSPEVLNALMAGLAAQQGGNNNNNSNNVVGSGNGAINPLLAMGFGSASGNGNGTGFVSDGVNAFAPTNNAPVKPTGPAWNPYPQPGVHTPEGSSGKESSPSNGSSPEADTHAPSRQTSTSSNLQANGNSQRQASTGSTTNGTSSRMTSPPLNPVIDELKHGHTPVKSAAASGSHSNNNAAAGSSASSRRGSQSGRAKGAKNQESGSGAGTDHKRKAEGEELGGHDAHRRHLDGNSDEDTSDDDQMTGTGRKPKKTSGRRKSSGAGAEDQTPESKALKRKNQNRAAQKAFRERREARVKDLEDKVAELESKNAGQAYENENLRQMLSKLQKENMNFKSGSGDFTFSMPIPDREVAADQSIQSDKLPSPPLSLVASRGEEQAESSRARRDNSTPGASSHNGASSYDSPSSGMGDQSSPDAPNSAGTGNNGPALFNPEPYNAFIPNNNNGFSTLGAGPSAFSPFATAAENLQSLSNNDLQQLLAAFRDQQQGMGQTSGATPQFSGYREGNSPAAMDADAGINETDINEIFGNEDAMNAFLRSLSGTEESNAEADVLDILPAPPAEPSIAPWTPANPNAPAGMSYGSDLFGSYMLRGFKGTPNGFPDTNAKSIKKEPVGSGSSASASMDTGFSPSNYLTTSPDPMGHASTSAEGAKDGKEICPFGEALKTGVMPSDGDLTFNVKGEDGQMLTSQELWTNLQSKVDLSSGFDLDDLCDNFKAKAKCDGTGPVISKVEVDKILHEYSAKRNASSTLI